MGTRRSKTFIWFRASVSQSAHLLIEGTQTLTEIGPQPVLGRSRASSEVIGSLSRSLGEPRLVTDLAPGITSQSAGLRLGVSRPKLLVRPIRLPLARALP